MSDTRTRLTFLLTFPPALLAAAYVWGTVYYQTLLAEWGLNADDFPLSPPQIYLRAFWVAVDVVTAPFSWLEQSFPGWARWATLCLAPLAFGLAWLSTRSWARRAYAWLTDRDAAKRRAAGIPEVVRRGIALFVAFVGGLAAPLLLSLCLSVIGILLIGPPLWAAKDHANKVWQNKEYRQWREVSWKDDAGATQTGFEIRCSERLCGVLQNEKTLIVPAGQIRYLPVTPIVTRAPANTLPTKNR
jgi:hypothetical protein